MDPQKNTELLHKTDELWLLSPADTVFYTRIYCHWMSHNYWDDCLSPGIRAPLSLSLPKLRAGHFFFFFWVDLYYPKQVWGKGEYHWLFDCCIEIPPIIIRFFWDLFYKWCISGVGWELVLLFEFIQSFVVLWWPPALSSVSVCSQKLCKVVYLSSTGEVKSSHVEV